MMMKRMTLVTLWLPLTLSGPDVFAQQDKQEVLHIVQQFFDAMENNDSLNFRNVFLAEAYNYYIQEKQDTVRAGGQSPFGFKFRNDRIIKERFADAGVNVQVHKRIAVVLGPYNLWVNNKFSHCGVDVFTLLKTEAGWKIASLAFSLEDEGCNDTTGNSQSR